jgi:hypothetical protein
MTFHDTEVSAGAVGTRTESSGAVYARLSAGLLALAVMSVLVLTGSRAAFTETTQNPGNAWNTGLIELTDDDENSAMFTVTDMKPGEREERCITVTYTGPYNADISLYATPTGDLAAYLDVIVEVGDGGQFGDCDGFVADAGPVLVSATLDTFPTTPGVADAFSASAGVETSKTFRFDVTLQADPDAMNKGAGATFTWRALTETANND